MEEALAQTCPAGIDIYFDNVGGDHLQAALTHMNPFGRIPACGMISAYNNTEPAPGPNNHGRIVRQRLLVKGFIVSDHLDRRPAFMAQLAQWLRDGRVKPRETVVDAIENATAAFIGLLHEKVGKMLLKVGSA